MNQHLASVLTAQRNKQKTVYSFPFFLFFSKSVSNMISLWTLDNRTENWTQSDFWEILLFLSHMRFWILISYLCVQCKDRSRTCWDKCSCVMKTSPYSQCTSKNNLTVIIINTFCNSYYNSTVVCFGSVNRKHSVNMNSHRVELWTTTWALFLAYICVHWHHYIYAELSMNISHLQSDLKYTDNRHWFS